LYWKILIYLKKTDFFQNPEWLGLPHNAETVLLTNLGKTTLVKLLKMQQLDDEVQQNI